MSRSEDAVEMFVGGLVLDPKTQAPVVILKDETGAVCIPIWIGIAEATSIASAIKQVHMPRPLTHDLLYTVLGELSVQVQRIVITDLKDSTYFAELVLTQGEKAMILDSRPSDAIAIALRAAAPIFVTQSVLDQAKMAFSQVEGASNPTSETPADKPEGQEEGEQQPPQAQQGQDFTTIDRDKWTEILSELDPEDFKYKM